MNQTSERKPPVMLTIRQCAEAGPLPEFTLRTMQRRGELPGFQTGNRFYVNYTKLIDKLEAM